MTANRPDWLRRLPEAAFAYWRHGWTTGAGPDFSSPPDSPEHASNVANLVYATGLRHAAWVRQVHGGQVLEAKNAGFLGEADAMWTSQSGLGVVGRSADCPLILIAGQDATGQGLWGFVHASWRSTVEGITASLLQQMTAAGMQPEQAHAIICPSAGPCCYEVGPEVREQAVSRLGPGAELFFRLTKERFTFDLWRANCAQMKTAGLTAGQITVTGTCTICSGKEFPSHRREHGRAGRFAAISGGDNQATR